MNALDFVNENENVIVRFAGQDIAWIASEMELPFDMEDVDGEVGADGQFTATNLTSRHGPYDGWAFSDWDGNPLYEISLRVDAKVWAEQYKEFLGRDAAVE